MKPLPARLSLGRAMMSTLLCSVLAAPVAQLAQAATVTALAAASAPAPVGSAGQPVTGRSLFEQLLDTEDGGHVVPFPFPALLQRLRAHLDPRQPMGGLAVVLIPLGRSLQRHAAGDVDAFRYPRVVAAATGEPPADAPPGHPYLKDRLYVAYHEKAESLEIISYNEDAGRFEFQLVLDYRAGARPRIVQANRSLCLACHQNAAPIFSRPAWDETSASPPIAARLAATGRDFYGLPWRHGVDVPDAIDAATARANRLALVQSLWQLGCAANTPQEGIECRAEALLQALLLRLGGSPADAADTRFRTRLLEPLLANWSLRWPQGLVVPDPQIPNRQPFAGFEGGLTPPADAQLADYADIGAAFDPLALRAPLEHWAGRDAVDIERFLRLLGGIFSDADLALIARLLAQRPPAPAGESPLSCTARAVAGGERLDLDCADRTGLRLQMRLHGDAASRWRFDGGVIDRLQPPQGAAATGVALARSGDARPGSGDDLRFEPIERPGAPLRLPGGERITRLVVSAMAPAPPAPSANAPAAHVPSRPEPAAPDSAHAEIRLTLVDDLQPLRDAVEALAERNRAGQDDALTDAPLRRHALLGPLLTELGVSALAISPLSAPWPRSPLPPSGRADAGHGEPPMPEGTHAANTEPARSDNVHAPRAAPAPSLATRWPDDLQAFLRQCSQCHAEDAAFPPSFLRGDEAAVRTKLAACAARIYYRLQMNRLPPGARLKTPMPPPAAPHAADFARSTDLDAMQALLGRLLQAGGKSAVAVLEQPYASLPPCRPSGH